MDYTERLTSLRSLLLALEDHQTSAFNEYDAFKEPEQLK